jgi:hypothetical protein
MEILEELNTIYNNIDLNIAFVGVRFGAMIFQPCLGISFSSSNELKSDVLMPF